MPNYQTGKGVVVVMTAEATLNTAPGTSGGTQLRLNPSPGLTLQKASIRSNEIRPDGLTLVARHGSRSVEGSYTGEMSAGSHDFALAAVVRSTHVAAVTITEATASLASITFGTNTIVATSTSTGSGFLQAGIRVGDVFRITGVTTDGSANNSKNLRVRAVTTHTLTVMGTGQLTASTTAATTFTFTTGKKLKNGTTPTRRSFYVDQYYRDIDQSEVFGGVRLVAFRVTGGPDSMAEIELRALGVSGTALATGSSPYSTSYTSYTSAPLTLADATIYLGNEPLTIATQFELNYEITADTLPVIGSNLTPDVFDNDARLSGTITILRQDLARFSAFDAETEYELQILLVENEAEPKDYIQLFVPKLKFMNLDAPIGSDGGMLETIPWEAGLRESASGYDQTMITISTSAS